MARILQFDRGRRGNSENVDAAKVWNYVVPRLGFPLPDFISDEIDRVIGEIWNTSEGEISFEACVSALESLARVDIMIPLARREKIVELVFEYLEKNGYIYEGG
ncbi:MAG TPA: hypothetical protein VFB30_17370 [Spirochaetia bacterium]|nr:hypothetical protein [Spirochaetia bacterium]